MSRRTEPVRPARARLGPLGRTRWCSVMLVLAVSMPATSAAQAVSVELQWSRGRGAETCIAARELRADVARRLGRDPFGGGPRSIEGIIERREDLWVVDLFLHEQDGPTGHRTFQDAHGDCRALDGAVGLAIALLIDPRLALRDPQEPDAASEAPEDAASEAPEDVASEEPEEAAVPEPPPVPPPPGLAASVGASGTLDLVPGASAGVYVRAEGPLASWLRLSAALLWAPERLTDNAGAQFGIGLTAFELGLCALPFETTGWMPRLCVDAMAGAISAVVYAPQPVDPGARPWGAVRASVAVAVDVAGPFGIDVGLGAIVPFVRHAFRVEELETPEFVQPFVIPELRLGLFLRGP